MKDERSMWWDKRTLGEECYHFLQTACEGNRKQEEQSLSAHPVPSSFQPLWVLSVFQRNSRLSSSDSCHFHSNRKSLVAVNRLECNNKLLAKPFPVLDDIRSQQSHWHSRLTVANKKKKKKTLQMFSVDHLSQHMQPCETLPVAAAPRVSCHNEGVMSSCDSRPDPTRPDPTLLLTEMHSSCKALAEQHYRCYWSSVCFK